MKEFINPEPIQCSVEDKNGEKHVFTLKVITPDEMDNITDIAENFKEEDKKTGSIIKKQLVIMFGKDENFYSNFALTILTKVMNFVTGEMQNPELEKKKT